LIALHEREVSGEGQWVQSNLLQAQIALLDFQAARYLLKGEVAPQVGNDHPVGMPTSAYKSKDGYLNIGASGQVIWRRFCGAIGREDMAANPDFEDEKKRSKNRVALNAEINQALAAKTTAEWVEVLNTAGVPSGPIYTIDQVFADPQVRQLQAAASVRHPKLGELRLVNQAVKLTRTPASLKTPTPDLGAHTEEILSEIGYSAEQIRELRSRKVV